MENDKETSEEKEVIPKILDVNSWDISLNNKEFKLELGKSEDKKRIIFKLINYKEFPPNYYILFFNKDDFNGLNQLFCLFKTIDEIYSLLFETINNKQYKLVQEDKAVILIFNILLFKNKNLDISFKLKESNNSCSIEILYLLMHELSEECKSIKEQSRTQRKIWENNIKKLKNEIDKKDQEIINIKNELKKEIDKKDQEIINIKNELKNKIDKKDQEIINIKNELKKNDIFNVSKIIKLEEEKNKLISWISEKGKIKEIKLLYSSKKDGDDYSSFYNKCKNISPTLSLIKTKKGRRFGGFTFGKWNDEKGFLIQKDSEAFLFSLDNMKNYKILKPNFAIFSATDHSSFLGYGCSGDGKAYGIFLRDNYLTKGGGENHTSRVYNIDSQNCLSTEKDFYVEEVEVYNIIFN